MPLYLGLISGTSMDGIDAALVDFDAGPMRVLAYRETPYPAELRAALQISTTGDPALRLRELMRLDVLVGRCFAEAALALLESAGVRPDRVAAIGSHGQTLLHSPDSDPPFTLQIGDPAVIAVRTGITTVADFRRMDLAAGGQGAPLVPAFHAGVFRDPVQDRAVVNIGGIANLTLLPADASRPLIAFDCGPGNCLLDEWHARHRGGGYDAAGAWAAGGRLVEPLLAALLDDPYFARPAPKSTGRDYFNLDWLRHRGGAALAAAQPADVQATLAELTARSIAQALHGASLAAPRLLVCGGGAQNAELLRRLRERLPGQQIGSTAAAGLPPEQVEAVAFAWFARCRLQGVPLPASITGAIRPTPAGSVFEPRIVEPVPAR